MEYMQTLEGTGKKGLYAKTGSGTQETALVRKRTCKHQGTGAQSTSKQHGICDDDDAQRHSAPSTYRL